MSDRSFPVFLWEEWFWWIVDMKHMLVEPLPRSGDDIQIDPSTPNSNFLLAFCTEIYSLLFSFCLAKFLFLSINLFRFSAFKAKAVLLSLQHSTAQHIRFNYDICSNKCRMLCCTKHFFELVPRFPAFFGAYSSILIVMKTSTRGNCSLSASWLIGVFVWLAMGGQAVVSIWSLSRCCLKCEYLATVASTNQLYSSSTF